MDNKRWVKIFLLAILVWFIFFLIDMLFGYDAYMRSEKVKFPAKIHPEQNEVYDINGQRYRVIYIGGVRFHFPENYYLAGNDPGPTAGVNFGLYWPDIPPGKVPGIKINALEEQLGKIKSVEVQVRGTEKPIEKTKSKVTGLPYYDNPDDYIIRDDLTLGYRTFIPKSHPRLMMYIYSLNRDAIDPWTGEPVVYNLGYINFSYTSRISVRIIISGRGIANPDWKGIYLGVVETLNKYRQDKY